MKNVLQIVVLILVSSSQAVLAGREYTVDEISLNEPQHDETTIVMSCSGPSMTTRMDGTVISYDPGESNCQSDLEVVTSGNSSSAESTSTIPSGSRPY